MARIGIDGRFFGPVGKGLGRYTQKLIENLERVDQENKYFIFLKKENFEEYKPKNPNFKKVLADFKWYGWEEQFKFPKLIRGYNLDLVHFLHFNVPIFYFGKFIVTIHDLILLSFPTLRSTRLNVFVYWFKFLGYKTIITSAILRSRRIIAVSRFTKNDILNNFKIIPQEKISVTYEACEDHCVLSPGKDEEILKRYDIIKPYLLYVGNAYPHKNLERLVLAFAILKNKIPSLKLVFVGKEDYFYSRLKRFVEENAAGDIIFPDFIPDFHLDIIYHHAACYVWPSLYEGFGLPPLEAMAKGTVVASSDHPCMLEVLGDSAYYFNGRDINSIAETVKELLENEELRKKLKEKGYQQIKKYNWKETAQKTKEIYQKVLSNDK